MQEPKRDDQQSNQADVTQSRKPIQRETASRGVAEAGQRGAQQEMPVRPQAGQARQTAPAPRPSGAVQQAARQDVTSRPVGARGPGLTEKEKPARPGAETRLKEGRGGYSPFWPLLGLALTLLVLVIFQTVQIFMDRDVLVTVTKNQEPAVAESKKVRVQFESIAKSTGQLAANGNVNAQAIVEQLRKQGITINLNSDSAR